MLQAALHLFDDVGARFFVNEGLDPGLHRLGSLDQLADGGTAPHQPTLFGEVEFGIGRVIEPICTQMEFGAQRLVGGAVQHPRLVGILGRIRPEAESFQPTGEFALDADFTLVVHLGHEGLLLLEPAHQH